VNTRHTTGIPLKLSALLELTRGLDTTDKWELSAHRPEWKVLFGDHTNTHIGFPLSTASARVTIVLHSPQTITKKRHHLEYRNSNSL